MGMIPSPEILCQILNDPAIPDAAKPDWGREGVTCRTNQMGDTTLVWSPGMGGVGRMPREANAALFWSMSAWLWDVGSKTMGVWRAADLGFMASTQCDKRAWAETPTEALADVVREVAKRQTR